MDSLESSALARPHWIVTGCQFRGGKMTVTIEPRNMTLADALYDALRASATSESRFLVTPGFSLMGETRED